MLYTNKRIGDRGTVPGIAGELDALKSDLSTVLVAARGALLDGLGSPAGAKRINRAAVLRRLEIYEDPASQEALKAIGDGDLVRLTKESIRVRDHAQSRGEWSPPAPPMEPPPPEPPMTPPGFPEFMGPMGLTGPPAPMGPTGPGPMVPGPMDLTGPPVPMEPVPMEPPVPTGPMGLMDLSGPAPIG